ncbi:MAG: hypothetical protein GY796_37115 [Chloroflexi bacterium]|nr:hypothetical protein [Chloroflexota bacterium]
MTVRRLFAALFFIALFAMGVREALDPDMWWHLRTGEIILQQGIPRQDVFSFTALDHAWVTHEWLSQVVMWLGYQAGGFPGLIVLFALLIALSYWLLYLVCDGRPYLAAFIVLLAAITSAIVWGVRPQIFNLLLSAVFVHVVERVKNGRYVRRTLWLLPLFMLFWANFHSGYLLGVVLLGTYVVGEAGQQLLDKGDERTLDWAAIRHLFVVTIVSFLVAVLNPSGTELWIYPFFTLGSSAMQTYIQEWHSPNFHVALFWPFAAMLAGGAVSFIFSQRRMTATDLLLFGGTGAAGLVSARNIPLFAVIATPIIARHTLSALWGTKLYPVLGGEKPEPAPARMMEILNWLLLGVAVMGVLGWTAAKIDNQTTAVAERYPKLAVDFLEANGLAEAHGYNSYNWGGYLIWRGLPVFVDGRADVYGDEFLFYYRETFDVKETWREPLDEFAVDYVLMEKGSPLTTVLAADGWQEIYQDGLAQIFVRP